MKRYLLHILFLLLCLGDLIAQPDTAFVNALYKKAKSNMENLNLEESRAQCRQLIKMLTEQDSFSLATKINVLTVLGNASYLEVKLNESEAYQLEALAIAKKYFGPMSAEQGMTYYYMACIYQQTFDLEKWKAYLDTAAVIFQSAKMPNPCWYGRIWTHKATMNYLVYGDPDSTLSWVRRASHIYQECGDTTSLFDNYKIFYDLFLSLRQFDSTEHYLNKQIEFASRQKDVIWNLQRAGFELSKAHVFRLNGQYERALEHYQYAKSLMRRGQHHHDTVAAMNCDLYTALCLNYTGKHTEGLKIMRTLLTKMPSVPDLTADSKALYYEGAAKAYESVAEYDSAAFYAEQALEIFRQIIDPQNVKLLPLYQLYSRTKLMLHDFKTATTTLENAYRIALDNYGASHPVTLQIQLQRSQTALLAGNLILAKSRLDSITDQKALMHYPDLAYQHAILSADQLIASTENKPLASAIRDQLIDVITEAMQRFRDVRNQYMAEEARSRSVSTSIASLQKLFPIVYEYYINEPNEDLYVLMLQLSELHRGLILSEAIGQSEAYKLAGIPEEMQHQVRVLKTDISSIRRRMEQEQTRSTPKKDYITSLLVEQIEKQKQLDQLIGRFQKEYPAYYSARFGYHATDISEIQRNLSSDEGLLEYLVIGESVYAFVFTNASHSIHKMPCAILCQAEAMKLIQLMTQRHTDALRQKEIGRLSELLYDSFVLPVADELKKGMHVILVPDRFLHYIPFEMLHNNGEYMIEAYPIQYQSSITLWLELKQEQEATVHSMLAMSPAFTENELVSFERKGLVALANADKECEQISRIWDGQWMSGQHASKANFLRRADESDIIHLATHASADDRAGLFSWLAFSSTGTDSLLYLDEIYSLSLDARMVVLSGCETGIGPLQTGEGLISLSRAFSYAGAESIITSLWPVQDAATAKIMTAFYTHLRNGESKDRALQLAKIEYLNSITDPDQADPYYWAGFVAIGNMTPLTLERSHSMWLTIGLVVMGLICVWIVMRYRNRRLDIATT